jgi:hypothetical protein
MICILATGFAVPASAQVATGRDAPNGAPNQWWTGSLEAPSPALPKAGLLALEPYVVSQFNTGAYGTDGTHQSVAHDTSTVESLLVIKYGITKWLTVEALPSISGTWNNRSSSTGAGVGDLPLELEYRVRNGDYRNGAPSVTFDLGVTLPTGRYDRLKTNLNGAGQGAYLLKQGVVLQSLFDTWGNHPVRIRVYGVVYEPLDHPSIADESVYGTSPGFNGRVAPGVSGEVGIGAGWAANRHWVLALDLVQNYADGYLLNGIDGAGKLVRTRGGNEATTALAPAVEYNISGSMGIIVGVEFSVAGRNTPSYVAPQIALAASF